MKRILIINAIDLEQFPIKFEGVELKVILSGIGKTNAAMNTMHAIMEFNPDLVVNVGSAGTINHSVGDIIVSHHFVDRDLQRMNLFGLDFDIISDYPEHHYPQSRIAGKPADTDFIVNTGDDFVTQTNDIKADAVDMEAFAEAMVCKKMHKPFVSIKYITDVVGENSVALWEEKLADARAGLAAFLDQNQEFFM